MAYRRPPPGIRQAIHHQPRTPDGHLHVEFKTNGPSSQAAITPTDIPQVIPMLWGRLASPRATLADGNGGTFQTRSIGTAESMPIRGPSGVLIDYSMFIRHATIQYGTTQTFIWARADTPANILDALAQHGIADPQTLTGAKHTLGTGRVRSRSQAVRRRHRSGDPARARWPRRHARRPAPGPSTRRRLPPCIWECANGLSCWASSPSSSSSSAPATIAGVIAGSIAQQVVVRAVTLGFVDSDQTPRIEPSLDVAGVVGFAALMLLVLLAWWLRVGGRDRPGGTRCDPARGHPLTRAGGPWPQRVRQAEQSSKPRERKPREARWDQFGTDLCGGRGVLPCGHPRPSRPGRPGVGASGDGLFGVDGGDRRQLGEPAHRNHHGDKGA